MCLLVCCHFIPDFFFLLVGLTDSWHRTLSCRCVHVLFCCWCWSWCCCWCEFNYRQLRKLERLELELLLLSLLFLTTTLPPPPQITMSMSCCCSWHTTSTLCCKLTRQTRLTDWLSFACPLSVANVVVHFVAERGGQTGARFSFPFPTTWVVICFWCWCSSTVPACLLLSDHLSSVRITCQQALIVPIFTDSNGHSAMLMSMLRVTFLSSLLQSGQARSLSAAASAAIRFDFDFHPHPLPHSPSFLLLFSIPGDHCSLSLELEKHFSAAEMKWAEDAAFANIFHSGALYRPPSQCVCVLPKLRRRRLKIEIERERRTQTTALAYLLIRPAKTREWFGFSREWLLLLLISLQVDSTLNCCCCSSLNFTPHCLANGRTSRHCCRCRTTSIIALDNNHWLFLSLSLSHSTWLIRETVYRSPGLAWPGYLFHQLINICSDRSVLCSAWLSLPKFCIFSATTTKMAG